MIHKIYSIFDSKAEAYSLPFYYQHEGQAMRTFSDWVNDPNTPYGNDVERALDRFFKEAALTQKIDVGAATPEALAKLGNFVSESISSQSQALGTGAPSQALNF